MAKVFEKEHKNVIRSIRNLECSAEFSKLNFELTDYIDKNGDLQPKYEISRDSF